MGIWFTFKRNWEDGLQGQKTETYNELWQKDNKIHKQNIDVSLKALFFAELLLSPQIQI